MNRGWTQPVAPVEWIGMRAVGEMAEWAHTLTVFAAGLALAGAWVAAMRLGVTVAGWLR